MTYTLSVFGTRACCPTRRELIEFIRDGEYLDEEPNFDPPVTAAVIADEGWATFTIDGASVGRGIVFSRHLGDDVLRDHVARLRFVVEKTTPSRYRAWVIDVLERSCELVTISVDAEGASRVAWEMLDNLECFIARRCDGMIYAPREGFYDADLVLRHRI